MRKLTAIILGGLVASVLDIVYAFVMLATIVAAVFNKRYA